MKRLLPLSAVLLLACNYLPGQGSAPRGHAPGPSPVQAPPGSSEESAPEPFDRLLARADAVRARRPIEALRLYREALAVAPDSLPADQRQQLEARITQLSFVLGVPRGEIEEPPSLVAEPPPEAEAAHSEAMARARALYAQAQEAEHANRNDEALSLYRQVMKTVREQDNAALYWNAWQKVEDLSPDGEGPAAEQEKQDRSDAIAEAKLEAGGEGDDGSTVPATGATAADGARAADVALSQARASYVKGMGYIKAQDPALARQAFQVVLELIRESQDPELYRAARQNLQDLENTAGKRKGP